MVLLIRNKLSLIIFLLSFSAANAANTIDSYWIWAGIAPEQVPANSVLYIYQGIFKRHDQGMLFSRKGLYPYPISAKEVYLTYRLQGGLPNPDSMIQALENWAKDWERHGAKISGFQLDFDSPTSGLLRYGDYLKQVRDKLSPKYKLSITGLGDWVLSGDQEALQSIATTVDEIIFQLYQGRKPFTNIDTYIEKFGQLQVEFKVGFLGSSDYQKSVAKLRKNKYFKGAVLFIQK